MSNPDTGSPRTRGRPKLGVIAREVTLLPRHWEWLAAQPGGSSVALRKLVEAARRTHREQDELRQTRDAAYQFMSAAAGDFPGFEEASRALFAADSRRFRELVDSWPTAVRDRVMELAFPEPVQQSPIESGPLPAKRALPSRTHSDVLDRLLPPEKREAARRAVAAAFGDAAIDKAARLPGGAAGPAAVIRLTMQGADYLLRVEGPPSPMRDPRRHYVCLEIAADAGVAPRLLHADVDHGIAISRFIHAAPGVNPPSAERMRAIAETVKTLHGAPLFPPLMPYLDCVDRLMEQLHSTGILPPGAVEEHLRLYSKLAAAYPRHDRELVSSHNDLNPSNVLFVGQRPWIVDWEAAFAADRYVDIAAIVNFFAADEDDEEIVLRTYFGRALGDYHRGRLFLMRQVNYLFYAAVLLSSVAAARPRARLTAANLKTRRFREVRGELASLATHEGRAHFGCVFLHEMLWNLNSPRFAQAIAQVVGR